MLVENIEAITSIDDVVVDGAAASKYPPQCPVQLAPETVSLVNMGTPPPPGITNADVIAAVFHSVPEGANVLVCSKAGDPSQGGWPPSAAQSVNVQCPAGNNNYINSASVRRDRDGSLHARSANFMAYHATVLDDVGTKVPLERIAGLAPSWIIETSPGNYQVGVIHDVPLQDEALIGRLQKAMSAKGLSDPDAPNSRTRWFRLPIAINGKGKYRDSSGAPYSCKFVTWNPERRYSVAQLVKMLAIEVEFETAMLELDQAAKPVTRTIEDETSLAMLKMLLDQISPDCGYQDWTNALMAVHNETGGSMSGFELANHWSSEGSGYPGLSVMENKWRSFRSGSANPLTVRTLVKMAKDNDEANTAFLNALGDGFLPTDMQCGTYKRAFVAPKPKAISALTPVASALVTPAEQSTPAGAPSSPHFLERFSLRGDSAELEKRSMGERPILGEIGLYGQLMVIYAAPNTGKTLITLHLLVDAINRKRINPDRLFYLNMDDNSKGLAEKGRIADDYGFHMLAGGYKGFKANDLEALVTDMVEKGKVDGAVLVLDTMKKFVNVMDKKDCSRFSAAMRNFAMQGGTLISLAHVNKKVGPDGLPVYGGTTDIRDDFDNAYLLSQISSVDGVKTVEFTNIKRRGNNPDTAGYSYSVERMPQYDEVLMSVREVDPLDLAPMKTTARLLADDVLIKHVQGQIKAGCVQKMELIKAVSDLTGASRADVGNVVTRYTGGDTAQHRWIFKKGARGAHLFELLDCPAT
ncbi:MAG: PriCT-2 domain-containing protein [Pseudomonadota bacterium]